MGRICAFNCKEHTAPVLPCWYCNGKDGEGDVYDPKVHHGWLCEACDERRATIGVIEAARDYRAAMKHESRLPAVAAAAIRLRDALAKWDSR